MSWTTILWLCLISHRFGLRLRSCSSITHAPRVIETVSSAWTLTDTLGDKGLLHPETYRDLHKHRCFEVYQQKESTLKSTVDQGKHRD